MDHSDHLDVVLPADCVAERLRVDYGAPFIFDAFDSRPDSGGNVFQPAAEEAIDGDDDSVAGLQEVDEGRFHAGGAVPDTGRG